MKTTPTTGTPTTGGGSLVTIAEIADFLRHLRNLSRAPTPDGTNPDGTNPDGTNPDGTNPDGTNPDRAMFLARKADLFARIAAQHPELLPPTPPYPADGGPADGGPADGGPADGGPA
jgi:hypothetical protein